MAATLKTPPTARTPAPDAPAGRREATRQMILAAAKELVAMRGPHATTVRDITEAMGANVAAVNYYFQSKDELLAQAMAEIVGDVNRERELQLRRATEASGGVLAPEEILRALIEPIGRASRSADGGSLYLRIFQHIRINPADGFSTRVFDTNSRVAQAFLTTMAATFPDADRLELAWRYEFARGAAAHLLGNLDIHSRRTEALTHAGALPPEPAETLGGAAIERTIALILDGFTGPASAETRPGEDA